ncbi:MAG: glycosyltransferase [Pseudomonadales bacterium]|nr:glycosyltransferase [Pseudomonadales bacterium]
MKSILIVAHKYLTQPDDELVVYLNSLSYKKVMHICHSFSDATDRRSVCTIYEDGTQVQKVTTSDYIGWPELLIYLKEFYFTLKWCQQASSSFDYYIGMDGLCVFFGNILRMFKCVKSTVFWAIDFVPDQRFDSNVKSAIYTYINKHGYRKSDQMWDLSPRMAEAREYFGHCDASVYKHHAVVPYGMWLKKITHYSFENCERSTLVFMGHLLEKQGVQLVIQAIPTIIESIPNFTFKIIGDGAYRKQLEEIVKNLGVQTYCHFYGRIDDIRKIEQEIAISAIAIATYVSSLDTWTKYADPGKIKSYLACGVPVITTELPWNAKEIAQANCGKIIQEDIEMISKAVVELLDPTKNQQMRENALQYAKDFDYENIFRSALENLTIEKKNTITI